MKQIRVLLIAILLAPLAVLHAVENPLPTARVVWQMNESTTQAEHPYALKNNGTVKFEKLEGVELEASLKRAGTGFTAVLDPKSFLSIDSGFVKNLRPSGDALTLYARAWFSPKSAGTLLFSDFLTLGIHPSGLAIALLGVKTPNGKVYRELPLAMVEKDQWLDLVLRVGKGRLDFFCNGRLVRTISIRQSLASPFTNELRVGKMRWLPSKEKDAMGHPWCEIGNKKIATVALWDNVISDRQVAFLSGVEKLAPSAKETPFDKAMVDYNRFFDASVEKDVATCGKLHRSLQQLAVKDPARPIYHLSQPLGWLFDPAGAWYYKGKYHVFSYHNIYARLAYNSLDHYVSDDLIHWTQWPIGPWADSKNDIYGIWLNNHFLDDKGVPTAIYSAIGEGGNQRSPELDWGDHGILARSHDGLISFPDKKVVMPVYQHDGHTWKEGDTWYCLTSKQYRGSRPGSAGDAIMIYTSPDLEHWQERGEIFTRVKDERNKQGTMEFPYLLSFGNKEVLIAGVNPVRYWVGRFDRQQFKFIPENPSGQLLDYTFPNLCFNPLTVDQKGAGGTPRRILMAMIPDLNGGGEGLLPWDGIHALPRKLEFDGQHLRQEPLPEFEKLRGEQETRVNTPINPGTTGHISTRGDAVEINALFEPGDAQRFGVKLRISDDGGSFVRVWFDTATGDYGIDGQVKYKGSGP